MGKTSKVLVGLLLTFYGKTFAQQIDSITLAMEPFMNGNRPETEISVNTYVTSLGGVDSVLFHLGTKEGEFDILDKKVAVSSLNLVNSSPAYFSYLLGNYQSVPGFVEVALYNKGTGIISVSKLQLVY